LDKHIHKHFCDPITVYSGETIFKPAEGRLTGQRRAVIRQSPTGYFHYRIFPQLIAVISIFITTGNLENPLFEKLKELMFDITGMAPVPKGISHFPDQTYPVFNLPEEKKSSIGTDLTAIEIGFNFFIGNSFKKSSYLLQFFMAVSSSFLL